MYEVGDKVIYQGADKNAYKKVGVLKSIEEKDGKPQLTVEFEGGETFTAPVDDWSKEFTNAARNAKFKVGDKVKVVGKGLASKGWVGKVAEVRSGGWPYVVKFDGRENGEYAEGEIAIANSSPCVSTNSIVRNAMAANRRVARNAESPEDYDDNMHMVISSIAHDLEKTVLQLGKAVSLWEKADKSKYAKGEAEEALVLDRRLYSLVMGALQYMRKAKQASA
jgi:hypothetical protein